MIRLFVPAPLDAGAEVVLGEDQAHYLVHVMRQVEGARLALFNGRDGEWAAKIALIRKKACVLACEEKLRDQQQGPDLDLIIAVVKRARLETMVEKAAELGARRVLPVFTERTNAERVNTGRLQAIATEAAEQTGRLDVPEVQEAAKLKAVLEGWGERKLMFCDEAGDAKPVGEALARARPGPFAILIGPEGGFSPDERARIRALPAAIPVSLGPRILRADTAAISALTLWQANLGDWRA